jgi:colanic acid biosynthesis glycosyl transferase WcaI
VSGPRVQLWSYNYDPEPTGIGPVSRVWAIAMAERGWDVEVVAAHPHYPEPQWGHRLRPYREIRDGVRVLRLPLWIGRDSGAQRLRQEGTFAAALGAATPFLGRPDVIVAVSPCFPALAPAIANSRLRRVPWVLWLQDLVTEGAATTGLLDEDSVVMRASRRLENLAYRSASSIVVISDTFRDKVVRRGVPEHRVHRIYNPATRPVEARRAAPPETPFVLSMGNIGHSQGLEGVVRAFEGSPEIRRSGVRMVITGHGMAAGTVSSARTGAAVEMPGLVSTDELDRLLAQASLGLVSQRDDIDEFNLPSKLMNFMAKGVPVVASVSPASEVARLVERADAGWVVPTGDDAAFGATVAAAIGDPMELERRGRAGHDFARRHFTPAATAEAFEALLGAARQHA